MQTLRCRLLAKHQIAAANGAECSLTVHETLDPEFIRNLDRLVHDCLLLSGTVVLKCWLVVQGYANFRATQRPHTVDNSNFLDSRKGTMGFFNAGSSLFASENGLAEAQKFFQSKRGRRTGR